MAETKTTIRLGTDGAATVRADFAAVGAAGTAAMAEITAATNAAAAANDRYTQRQLDSFTKQAAAAKLAAVAERSRAEVDTTLGIRPVETGAAKASYEAFATLSPALVAVEGEVEKVNAVLGLNRQQTVIAQSAVLRFVDTLAAGQSPLRAFALEAHKIPEVLSVDDGGMAGGLAKVTGLLTPFNIGLAVGTIAVIAAAAAAYSYAAAIDKLGAASVGSGRVIGTTGAMLEANAESAAKAGNLSVAAAREIETAFVQVGNIGTPVLAKLTALTRDFAFATGQEVKGATDQLAKAFTDPAKGAEELAARYGILTTAQVDQIRALVAANDDYAAQKVLVDALGVAFKGAAENAGFLERAGHAVSVAWHDAVAFVGLAVNEAVDGYEPVKKLAMLQKDLAAARATYSGGLGQDTHLAELASEVAAQQKVVAGINATVEARRAAAKANSDAVVADKAVRAYSGADQLDDLRRKLAAVNATLANSKAPTAALREEQDALTHAVSTFLPEAEKQRRSLALDAQIAATTDPARKATLATEKERLSLSGKVVTAADAEADARAKGMAASAGRALSLGREAEAMAVAARASLDLARAFLAGGDAAIEAEARKKAATDATKKGIDVEAQVRRQLAVNVAEGAATGAKAADGVREETEARDRLNALVVAGTINTAEANDRLRDEAILRPLLKLQAVAQGEELTVLTQVIDTYRGALDAAHAAEKRWATNKIVEDARNTIAGLQDAAEFAADRSGAGAVEIARRAALRAAAAANVSSGEAGERATAAAAVETNKLLGDRVKLLADGVNSRADAAVLDRAELASVGLSANARTLILDRLREEAVLRAHGVDLSTAAAQADLAGVEAEDRLKFAVVQTTAAMDELRNAGGQLVDDVLNPSNWSSWGSLGKTVLRDIENEFIKLAALNPLKNLLGIGGGGAPTLGSIGGLLGGLFGGGDPVSGGIGSLVASNGAFLGNQSLSTPHNASGTEYFSGGATWIAENGPERVTLPRGTRIDNASATRREGSAAVSAGPVHQHFYLDGAIVDQALYGKMQTIGVNAAAGGAAMAKDDLARTQRRTIR